MHVPNHADELPDHVDPIPVPETKREAEMLLILLEAGLYPKYKADRNAKSGSITLCMGRRSVDEKNCFPIAGSLRNRAYALETS